MDDTICYTLLTPTKHLTSRHESWDRQFAGVLNISRDDVLNLVDELVASGFVEKIVMGKTKTTAAGTTTSIHRLWWDVTAAGRNEKKSIKQRMTADAAERWKPERRRLVAAIGNLSAKAMTTFAWFVETSPRYPNQTTIVNGMGAPVADVKAGLKELQEEGLLEVQRATTHHWNNIPRHYRLTTDAQRLMQSYINRGKRDGISPLSYF